MLKPNSIKSIFTLVIIALFLTGCTQDSGDSGDGGDDSPPITETVRLQWWGVFWDESIVEELIADYESQNPNVEIEYVNKWQGGPRAQAAAIYKSNLEGVLKDNNTAEIPDIFMVDHTWAGDYDEIYTTPAPASVTTAESVRETFYDPVATDFITSGTSGEQVNGLPLWMDTLAILYNRDMLEEIAITEPPEGWVQFRNVASSATKRTAGSITQGGFAAGTGSNVSFGVELFFVLLFQNQVSMTDFIGNPVFADSPDAQVALDFYRDFNSSGAVASWNTGFENDSLSFLESEVAMIAAPSWRYSDILFFNDTYNLGLDIGVAPLPYLDAGNPVNWADYWGLMVSRNRPHAEESWEFINWLTEKEQLRALRIKDASDRGFFGFMYPRKDMANELSGDRYLSVYNASLDEARSWYMVDGLDVFREITALLDSEGRANELSAAQTAVRNIIESKGIF